MGDAIKGGMSTLDEREAMRIVRLTVTEWIVWFGLGMATGAAVSAILRALF